MPTEFPTTVYHYASLDRLDWIKEAGHLRGRILGNTHPQAWQRKLVFCLENPQPDSWVKNGDFDYAWKLLKSQVGKLLLEIDIQGIEDQVQVFDWAAMERHLSDPQEKFNRLQAETDYLASEISFADFLANRGGGFAP